jgi:hypothetical protein
MANVHHARETHVRKRDFKLRCTRIRLSLRMYAFAVTHRSICCLIMCAYSSLSLLQLCTWRRNYTRRCVLLGVETTRHMALVTLTHSGG